MRLLGKLTISKIVLICILLLPVAVWIYLHYGDQLSVWKYNAFLDGLEEPYSSASVWPLPGSAAYLRGMLTKGEAEELRKKLTTRFGESETEMLFRFAEAQRTDYWNQYSDVEIESMRAKSQQDAALDD
jgi:hypothetical protein